MNVTHFMGTTDVEFETDVPVGFGLQFEVLLLILKPYIFWDPDISKTSFSEFNLPVYLKKVCLVSQMQGKAIYRDHKPFQ